MFATVLLSLLVPAPVPALAVAAQDPPVRIELNNDRQFVRGERGKVKIRTDDDGFLVVLHADPDGRVRVLFPLDPDDDNYVRGRHTYELRDRGDRETFTVEAGSGQGAIYAAVSRDPFRFDAFAVNQHWDYDALNAQDPGSDPEPVLDDIIQRMASGRYDYDYVTYDVYESEYSSVSYAAPAVVYTPSSYYYSSYYCDSFYDYYCDPYYYSPYRFSVSVNYGSPFYYRPYYYPYYYGYYGYYRPVRYYGYPTYSYPYYNTPGVIGYRQRYTTPSEFKQSDRLWGGVPYRDRMAASPVRSVNTVYDPAPVRRGTTSGDMGRSPVAEAAEPGNAEPRRRDAVSGQRSTVNSRPSSVERQESSKPSRRSTVDRRPSSVDRGSSERSGSGEPRRAAPTVERRPSPSRSQGEPQLERRTEPRSAPTIERAPAPSRRAAEPRVSPPVERVEPPRRVERPAPQVRSAPRSEPSMRSAPPPPPRSSAAPARASAPRPEPSHGGGGGGGGAGGRRGPR